VRSCSGSARESPSKDYEAAIPIFYKRKRTEPIVLQLEEPGGVGECLGFSPEKHGVELRGHCVIVNTRLVRRSKEAVGVLCSVSEEALKNG
jgi:hypothetical protein